MRQELRDRLQKMVKCWDDRSDAREMCSCGSHAVYSCVRDMEEFLDDNPASVRDADWLLAEFRQWEVDCLKLGTYASWREDFFRFARWLFDEHRQTRGYPGDLRTAGLPKSTPLHWLLVRFSEYECTADTRRELLEFLLWLIYKDVQAP